MLLLSKSIWIFYIFLCVIHSLLLLLKYICQSGRNISTSAVEIQPMCGRRVFGKAATLRIPDPLPLTAHSHLKTMIDISSAQTPGLCVTYILNKQWSSTCVQIHWRKPGHVHLLHCTYPKSIYDLDEWERRHPLHVHFIIPEKAKSWMCVVIFIWKNESITTIQLALWWNPSSRANHFKRRFNFVF